MKKRTALALTFALAGALSTGALAADSLPEPVAAPPQASHTAALTLNGQSLDTAALPAAPGPDLVPLRLVAEADHGSAYWDEASGTGSFYLEGNSITVTFSTGAVSVNDQETNSQAQVVRGVTFVPAGVLDLLEGYSADTHPELDVERIDITTPNGDPMVQLAYQLMETAGTAAGMKCSPAEMEEYFGIHADGFTQAVGFFPMMTSPDTLILGKVSEGKLDQVKAELEAYRRAQEDTFSWYLSQNLPKVQNAQVAVSGEWVLFVIGDNAAGAAAQLEAAVKGL